MPNPTHPSELTQHAERLRAVAIGGLRGTPAVEESSENERLAFLNGFRDEYLNRRPTDRPLLARVLGIDPGPIPEALDPAAHVWWALHDRSVDPADSLIGPDGTGDGPLVYAEADRSVAIEWRTLDELTALHALWNLSVERERPDWRERCLAAARWHLRELQPDNATNQPWAVHVFLTLARESRDADTSGAATFHAETLLHSCQVQQGHADVVSGFVLLDAARMLETQAW